MEYWGKKNAHRILFFSRWLDTRKVCVCGWMGARKKARNLKVTATFYGFGGHETWKIRFSIFWPWLLHERGVSQLFHLTTVLENANFSCFAKNFVCVATKTSRSHTYSVKKRERRVNQKRQIARIRLHFIYFFFFFFALFSIPFCAYHKCAYPKCVCVCVFAMALFTSSSSDSSKQKKMLSPSYNWLFQMKGHLTFILLGKVKSKSGIENNSGFELCACSTYF